MTTRRLPEGGWKTREILLMLERRVAPYSAAPLAPESQPCWMGEVAAEDYAVGQAVVVDVPFRAVAIGELEADFQAGRGHLPTKRLKARAEDGIGGALDDPVAVAGVHVDDVVIRAGGDGRAVGAGAVVIAEGWDGLGPIGEDLAVIGGVGEVGAGGDDVAGLGLLEGGEEDGADICTVLV